MSAGYEYDYELEEQIKRDIYLKRVENITRDHLNRYQNILNDIEIQGLDEYVYNDYISYENQLNFAFQCLSSDPERARDISMSIGKLIGALPKIAKERRRVYQNEEKERKIQRELQEKQLKEEFKDLIQEQLLKLKDPILRDFAQNELTILVKNFSEDSININNFEQVKLSFLKSSESILQTAQQKMNEFNEKYFQKIDFQMRQEALLEKVQEEKLNIKKIKTDDPAKLENIMNKLILTEKNINNGIINEDTDKFLNDISNEILNEEINEEYRRHTVKSILEILNKLGFQNVNPKKVGEDVKLYAKRINGNEFEATIKSNGTIMSHFNGYDYMACKDDIYSLEHELQNCYGIELNKTKTIWENPDRIQKNAKPLIELQKRDNMSKHKENWKRKLEIHANINKSIIIDGNINDLYYSTKKGHKFIPIVEEIYNSLTEFGFDDVMYWDIHSKELQSYKGNKDLLKIICKDVNKINEIDGNDYDIGGNGISENTKEHKFNVAKDYFDFLSKRLQTTDKDNRIAFIVDWTDSIFTGSRTLSEDEQNSLMILEKTIRNSTLSLDSTGNNDIVVLLSNSLSSIPNRYYQNNQSVALLHIPKPDRKDRAELLKNIYNEFIFDKEINEPSQEFEELIDSLDYMTVRDIIQLVKLTKFEEKVNKKISMKKAISLYKFGEKGSPWEDLSKDRIDKLEEELRSSVKGQDHIINQIDRMVKKAYMGLSGLQHSEKQQTPKGVLFFVGPTGTGKTELAKALARFLFGDEESYIRFDMSEYNHESSDQKLIGAPPGFVGYEEGGQLTNAVRKKPFSVLLFDEIEKAHTRILDKFLQILEDGRLTDSQGNTTYFTETVIIFTSNIGTKDKDNPNSAGVYDHINKSDEVIQKMFIDKVKEHFKDIGRPELLHRINTDNIVPFNFIKDTGILKMIINSKLKNLRERLKEKFNISDLKFEGDGVIDIITQQHDKTSGGRGILNILNSKVIEPLSEFLYSCNDKSEYNNKTLIIKRFSSNSDELKFEFR